MRQAPQRWTGGAQMAKLPKNLTELHIRKAVEYVEKEAAELVDLYYEQANIFSGIVGILGVKLRGI
jgi:hypothetical protein